MTSSYFRVWFLQVFQNANAGIMQTKTLVFSGGGTRCLVFVELLVLLENGGHFGKVCEYWGTSAGALIAALYALCHSAARVKTLLWDFDFSTLRNVDVGVMLNILQTWGIDDGSCMLRGIEHLLEAVRPGASKLKMRDIPGLYICVADLTIRETIVVNGTNFPDLRIAEAVRASMSFPIFLKPYISPNGHIWVDGGVRANFPWHVMSPAQRESALGFAFAQSIHENPRNLSEYMLSMIHFDETKKIKELLHSKQVIRVPSPPFPAWFLRLGESDYVMICQLAHTAYNNWISCEDGSVHPPKTSESLLPSAPHCIPPPISPAHHTVAHSGIPQACQEPFQDSSQHLQPRTQLIDRRWSL
jgi:predicted acylesterase/phospholipase RssA